MWDHVALILVKEYCIRSSMILTWSFEFICMNIVHIHSSGFQCHIFFFLNMRLFGNVPSDILSHSVYRYV
jgi:hypothetical protein